ncbi:MAG: hypothetical protein AMXMBFR47_26160 [Planctomycetota bacterium]
MMGFDLPFHQLARDRAALAIVWLERSIAACAGRGSAVYYSRWRRPVMGWYWPYPETTGYIIDTLLRYARWSDDPAHADRIRTLALDQADWIVSLQYPDGALPGSHVDRRGKKPPSVFNTGQMLIGLCAAADETAASAPELSAIYLETARKAADWLARGVDPATGTWTSHAYVKGHSPAYYTHVCWPLLEAWKRTGDDAHRDAAMRVLGTIAAAQCDNGAIRDWGFSPAAKAFTHTIGYTLWGFLESTRVLREIGGHGAAADRYIAVATRTAEVMLRKTELRGRLAAAFDLDWKGETWYACLTGNCQMASVWIRLAALHDDPRFLSVALKALDVVIDAQRLRSLDPNVRGAIGGSKPLYGRYLFMRYPNWAAKFFVDALMDADAALARLNS